MTESWTIVISISVPLFSAIIGQYINYRILLRRKRKDYFYKCIQKNIKEIEKILKEKNKTIHEKISSINTAWNIRVIQSEVIKKIEPNKGKGNFLIKKIRVLSFSVREDVIKQMNMIEEFLTLTLSDTCDLSSIPDNVIIKMILASIEHLLLINRGVCSFAKNNMLTILQEYISSKSNDVKQYVK